MRSIDYDCLAAHLRRQPADAASVRFAGSGAQRPAGGRQRRRLSDGTRGGHRPRPAPHPRPRQVPVATPTPTVRSGRSAAAHDAVCHATYITVMSHSLILHVSTSVIIIIVHNLS